MSNVHLAQINVARLHHPLDAAETAEFVAGLDPINAIAEASPGFVWRLTDADGNSSSYIEVEGNDDPLEIVNYSIWEDFESLKAFMYKTDHISFLRRRTEWFEPPTEPIAACWWIPAGTIPSVDEAYQRLLHLRANGPSEKAWGFADAYDKPDDLG